ncbi:MAG: FAD-dependent oxidoreductase, partial [Actinomycetota bacterium]|nr:FAD-dependent oxidoreductase [Actinomycetota bacterium]
MPVAVIGAGAVGLACARALARGGADVVVLERGRVGEGCSYGNTGWICPALSAPLPAPNVMGRSLAGMLHRDSPLRIQARLRREFLRWSWGFWRASTAERYEAGLRATVAFGARAFELYDELESELDVRVHRTGMVVAALTERGLEEYVDMIEGARRAGYDGPVETLDGDEVRRREPAVADGVVGGLAVPAERYVRPEELTRALAAHLREGGVDLREGAEVTRLAWRAGRWRVGAGDETLEADRVVLAAGAWSGRLLATLGVRIPLEAAKGY